MDEHVTLYDWFAFAVWMGRDEEPEPGYWGGMAGGIAMTMETLAVNDADRLRVERDLKRLQADALRNGSRRRFAHVERMWRKATLAARR